MAYLNYRVKVNEKGGTVVFLIWILASAGTSLDPCLRRDKSGFQPPVTCRRRCRLRRCRPHRCRLRWNDGWMETGSQPQPVPA